MIVSPIMVTKSVGVLLITYQSADDLPGLLESLGPAMGDEPFEVVCVDNASADEGPTLVEAFGGRVVRNRSNVGLSRAINQAALLTDAEWLLVVNPDTSLGPGSIARLVESARSSDVIGMIGPEITDLNGKVYPSGRRFPSLLVGIAHGVLGGVWPQNPATRRYFGPELAGRSDVDWISGCCMLFRRKAFDEVGGFDERYFLYFEETKMALDMHRNGWRVVLDPGAVIKHREGGSMRFAPFRKVRSHHRSALRFYCDYHRGTVWIMFAPLVAAGLFVRSVFAGLWVAITSWLRGK